MHSPHSTGSPSIDVNGPPNAEGAALADEVTVERWLQVSTTPVTRARAQSLAYRLVWPVAWSTVWGPHGCYVSPLYARSNPRQIWFMIVKADPNGAAGGGP